MSHKTYSYGKQHIDDADIEAVVQTLKSDWLTQGPKVKEFEDALCREFNARYGSVVSNGTAALHLIAMALGWKKGDLIITTPLTFLASANCAIYVGADVDFVDVDEFSYTLSPEKLQTRITALEQKGRRVKAVVAVDFAGHPCDWKALRELADQNNFQLVADSCHALGALYEGDKGYAARYADAVCLSFHPVKHITTGEGGAVLTNRKDVDDAVKTFRTHGMTKDPALMEKNDGPWYYEMHSVGYNYRLTDFQCALGLTQLQKLPQFVTDRRKIAAQYDTLLSGDDRFVVPRVARNALHAYHLYPLRIPFPQLRIAKAEFFGRLRESGIFCQVHYIPVHLQPFYRKQFGFKEGDFPSAERIYREEVSIPCYPGLAPEDLQYIVGSIKSASIKGN